MLNALKAILEIQEFDIKMIRLLKLRRMRQQELDKITAIKKDLNHQVIVKEGEIIEKKKMVRIGETELEESKAKITDLESKQSSIKKIEEFNALSQEISSAERERAGREQRLSDLYDQVAAQEDELKTLQESLESTAGDSKELEDEIHASITTINNEGRELKAHRDQLVSQADPELFAIYEQLLRNKKDRVVVPVENRCCAGCHITLTAQHENVVRKSERLVFCEHCSRIHYWPDAEAAEGTDGEPTKRRRRRTSAKV